MTLNERIEQVKKIPSLGIGGLAVYNELIKYSQLAGDGESIIDIGSWLGSTVGFLLAGLEQSGKDVQIHSYDRWIADAVFKKRAEDYHGISFELDQNILPTMMYNLSMFKTDKVIPHQGKFKDSGYDSERRIALVVDDICTYKTMTDHMFDIFEKQFIPTRTIVMMLDYFWFETRPEPLRKYQKECMKLNSNAGIFDYVGRPKGSMCSIWRYMGGKILRAPDKPEYHAEYY
jgi:hypothetical protein